MRGGGCTLLSPQYHLLKSLFCTALRFHTKHKVIPRFIRGWISGPFILDCGCVHHLLSQYHTVLIARVIRNRQDLTFVFQNCCMVSSQSKILNIFISQIIS
jgi:hypothetical protein